MCQVACLITKFTNNLLCCPTRKDLPQKSFQVILNSQTDMCCVRSDLPTPHKTVRACLLLAMTLALLRLSILEAHCFKGNKRHFSSSHSCKHGSALYFCIHQRNWLNTLLKSLFNQLIIHISLVYFN